MVYNDCSSSLRAGPRISFPGSRIPSLPQRMWLQQVKFRGLPRRAVMWGGYLLWLQHHAYRLGLEDKLRFFSPLSALSSVHLQCFLNTIATQCTFLSMLWSSFLRVVRCIPVPYLRKRVSGRQRAPGKGHQTQLGSAESENQRHKSSMRPCLDKRMIITLFFSLIMKKQR